LRQILSRIIVGKYKLFRFYWYFYGAFSLLIVLLGIALAAKGDTAQTPGVAAAKLMGV
jgi:hypothetical protein